MTRRQSNPVIIIFTACLMVLNAACSTLLTRNDLAVPTVEANTVESTIPQEPEPDKKEISADLKISVDLNENVQRWIEYFTVKDRERFQRFLDRGEQYREVVENVLEENELPAELYYLAMIESGFRTNAHSSASAVGVWQFIRGTGHRYGLKIDRFVDERRDPIRATEAAARYLRDLHNVFGSWHLAMAAYNAGEIRILRAIFKGRSRDFWELVDSKVLPKETAEYVPKFLAVVMIAKKPEKYGFKVSPAENPYPDLKAIEVPGGLSLAQIAKASGTDQTLLERVNPHLNRAYSAPDYEIWVPTHIRASVQASLPLLATLSQKKTQAIASKKIAVASGQPIHIVRRGENLSTIAKKYRVTVGRLKRMNDLRGSKIHIGARLRIQSPEYRASQTAHYKVRRGDNLTVIARKFSTSIRKIKARNKLRHNKLLVGQILVLKQPTNKY